MSDTKPPSQDTGSFMMLFSLMFLLFIMFNPELRLLLGDVVGIVFFPLIGFNNEWPVLSLMFAGLIMTFLSIVLRHKHTDWISMAKSQKMMKALGQARKEATLAGDQKRMEKLLVEQKKRGQEQMIQSSMQMKSTMSSFVFIIAIFTWVAIFIGSLENKTFSIPWATNVYLTRGGPVLKLAPAWIFIYSLVSIPLGQVIQKVLKEHSFKKRLEEMDSMPKAVEEIDPDGAGEDNDFEEEEEGGGDEEENAEVKQADEETDEEEGEEEE